MCWLNILIDQFFDGALFVLGRVQCLIISIIREFEGCDYKTYFLISLSFVFFSKPIKKYYRIASAVNDGDQLKKRNVEVGGSREESESARSEIKSKI